MLLEQAAGQALAGPVAGVAAALVFAISPLALQIGIQLRSDTALAFFATASVLVAVTRARHRRQVARKDVAVDTCPCCRSDLVRATLNAILPET